MKKEIEESKQQNSLLEKQIVYVTSAIEGKKSILPVRGSEYAHCHDLFLAEDIAMVPGDIKKVASGLAMEIPNGWAALIDERSSTITKYDITVEAGDIDCDYRGHVLIVLHRKTGITLWNSLKRSWNDYILKDLDDKSTAYANMHKVAVVADKIWTRVKKIVNPFSMLAEAIGYWRRRNKTLFFKRGDALAQIRLVPVFNVGFAKLPAGKSLSKTKRGKGGFGSTTEATKAKTKAATSKSSN